MSAFGNDVGGMANWPLCLRVQNCPSPWRLSGFWSFAGIQAQSILPAVAPCLARKSGLEQPSQETPGPMEPEITHWIFLQEWLPGFRKNPKGEENVQKEKKKKEKQGVFFFLHPLAPSCSSGIDIFLLEPWLIPTLTGQHGPIYGELKIQSYQRKLPSTWIYEDLLHSRHWGRRRRLNRAFCCKEDQPKRPDEGIKGLEWDGSTERGDSFCDQGKFPGEMLPIWVWWANRNQPLWNTGIKMIGLPLVLRSLQSFCKTRLHHSVQMGQRTFMELLLCTIFMWNC